MTDAHTPSTSTGDNKNNDNRSCCDDSRRCCCKRRRGWGRWVLGALLVIAIVFGAGAAYKAYRWSNMDNAQRTAMIKERIGEGVTDRLHLNNEQQQRLNVLSDLVLSEGARFQPYAMRSKALAIISEPQLDRAAAQALVDEIVQGVQAASPAMITAAAEFFDSLSPEQQAQLRDQAGRHNWRDRADD